MRGGSVGGAVNTQGTGTKKNGGSARNASSAKKPGQWASPAHLAQSSPCASFCAASSHNHHQDSHVAPQNSPNGVSCTASPLSARKKSASYHPMGSVTTGARQAMASKERRHDRGVPGSAPGTASTCSSSPEVSDVALEEKGGSSMGRRYFFRADAAVQSDPPAGGCHDTLLPISPKHDEYRENWSRVVLGATSGFMFVFVVFINYALYLLVCPYYKSITTAILLSVVLHPRNGLSSSHGIAKNLKRMRHDQRSWARRGMFFSVVGSWVSLRHFVSLLSMQYVYFLGLDKVCITPRRWLRLGCPTSSLGWCWKGSTIGACGETVAGRAACDQDAMAAALKADKCQGTGKTPLDAPAAAPVLLFERKQCELPVPLRTTAGGRSVLRCLAVCILSLLAHMLLGVRYFAWLHLLLFFLFAALVPFLSERTFIAAMGRLWRGALVLFFVIGISYNFTLDILAIGKAVKRTTAVVVENGAVGGEAMRSYFEEGARNGAIVSEYLATGGTQQSGPRDENASDAGPKAHAEASLATVLDQLFAEHQEVLQTFVPGSLYSLLRSKLATWLCHPSVREIARFAAPWITPWLEGGNITSQGGSSLWNRFFNKTGPQEKGERAELDQDAVLPSYMPRFLSRLLAILAFGGHPESVKASVRGGSLEEDSLSHTDAVGTVLSPINWLNLAPKLALHLFLFFEQLIRLLIALSTNIVSLFDSIYAAMLFVFLFRYLTQLEHTVLYYGIAKILIVVQPELGEYHARNIERDITVSFFTLLQSFWHLLWFHFTITFCVFKWWSLPTPVVLGVVSAALALFPLAPKWLSPCFIALLVIGVRVVMNSGVLAVLCEGQVLSLLGAVALDYSDEWLLCVSRGLRGGFLTDSAGRERQQLQPFVVGTSLVLGFVVYGMRGIVLGPLTVIVAKVLFDNWDIVLTSAGVARRGEGFYQTKVVPHNAKSLLHPME